MFSKARLDTLSDGIYGVAMALWALALNFAGSVIRVWRMRAQARG